MEEQIDEKVDVVLGLIRTNLKPDEVLKVTQALLNLGHAKQILLQGRPKKQGAGAT